MRKIYSLFLLSLCSTLMMAQTKNVTFVVDMNQFGGSFSIVNLNGTFNGWCGSCDTMTDVNNDGVYEITMTLNAPDTIEYKFTVDGWTNQENFNGGEPCTVTNGGFTNRELIYANDTVLDTVCWNSCASCALAPQPKSISFAVDMREYSASTYTTVNLNGDFNGWCGSCNPMSDADGDSIWTITLPLLNDSIEYKFTLDGWTGQENFAGGESCTKTTGGFTNRFAVLTGDTVFSPVCWESCMSCQNVPSAYNIGFQVDMNQYTGAFTTPEVNGDFNGWCGNCTPMSDPDGDGIWTSWVTIIADSIEYKFAHDNWTGQESLSPGSPCTKTASGFTNRFLTLSGDVLLSPVCWGECASCTGTPSSGNITFSVDMTKYTGPAFTTVNLNGSFNNWCGACAPMADPDNDSIYELTVNVAADTIDFKFTVDGWTGQENFAGGESCTRTVGGFTNRSFVVGGDSILPSYCWEACSDCASIGIEENELANFNVYPNPASESVHIKGEFLNLRDYTLKVMSTNGMLVQKIEARELSVDQRIDISNLPAGIYLVNIQAGNENQSFRLSVIR
mgnify:CR=1 FL=1|tara:strand:+ start:60 stop:1745 length:1686 start_codon:yes stop_codon:yes gene_type:complete